MATRDSDQIAAPLYSGIAARLLGGGWRRNREHSGNGGGCGNVCHVSMKTHLSVHHDSPPDELCRVRQAGNSIAAAMVSGFRYPHKISAGRGFGLQ
jgi:hypothetical protein